MRKISVLMDTQISKIAFAKFEFEQSLKHAPGYLYSARITVVYHAFECIVMPEERALVCVSQLLQHKEGGL